MDDEVPVFEALPISVSAYSEDLSKYYHVYNAEGECLRVEASSASEAVKKAGVEGPSRIINAAHEKRQTLEQNILVAEQGQMATQPEGDSLSKKTLVIDDFSVLETIKPEFSFFSLNDLAAVAEKPVAEPSDSEESAAEASDAPDISEDEDIAIEAPEMIEEEATSEEAVSAEESEADVALPAYSGAEIAKESPSVEEKRLSPAEVRNLLNEGEST